MKNHQFHINCGYYRLMGYASIPDKYSVAVILQPGFTHSMTDIDYFMTSLKNELICHDIAVIQYDPYGHGDSDGELHELTLDMLINNIKAVTNWTITNLSVEITAFSRGIYEIVLANSAASRLFSKSVCLNPVFINNEENAKINTALIETPDTIDIAHWFDSMDPTTYNLMESYFYTFGAKLKNIKGQQINKSFLQALISFCTDDTRNTNIEYIISRKVNECHKTKHINNDFDLQYYYPQLALVREPDWNYYVIKEIVKSFIK